MTPRRGSGPAEGGTGTKAKIVDAALETIKEVGYAGASARAIAQRGDLNPALIFYHFGSVNDALLAALDATSEVRMARYRDAVDGTSDLGSLLDVAARIYREDLESGHITVLAEMIAGAAAVPELGPRIVERIEPWIRFTEEVVERAVAATPFSGLLPARDVAFAIVALYLGMELLTHLDGDRSRAERAFGVGARLAELFGGLGTTS